MAGRFADMGAETGTTGVATRDLGSCRSLRLICAAALLCILGALSTTALRVDPAGHHHRSAVAAVTSVTDGHATNLRSERHAVVAAADTMSRDLLVIRGSATTVESATILSVHSARTRGPPALA